MSRAIKAAGLEGFSSHSLRHTFCTLFDGTDSALKRIIGHRSWQMVDRYRHKKDSHASAQHAEHSPLVKLYPKKSAEAVEARPDARIDTPTDKHISLTITNLTAYVPETREYPAIEVDGELKTLYPFMPLSIIPAAGWKAIFAMRDGVKSKELACFALIRLETGENDINGICLCEEGMLDSVEHHDNFLGYESPTDRLDWMEEWLNWHRDNNANLGKTIWHSN